MSFIDIAKERYSCRKYQDKKVEKEKLDQILMAAHVAPTAANCQPLKLLVIQEKEGLEKVNKSARTYGAPLVILVCGDTDKVWVRPFDGKKHHDIDTSIVTDHMMLQATELGLGTVWVCYFNPQLIRADFNLPDNLEPVNILVIGYPDGEPQSPDRHDKTRLPIESIVAYEMI